MSHEILIEANPEESVVISPIEIFNGLSMIFEGVRGRAKDEMSRVLFRKKKFSKVLKFLEQKRQSMLETDAYRYINIIVQKGINVTVEVHFGII